jgi:hypothetical protein
VRARDRAIGVALGLLLGLVIVIVFVFFGSGETIDNPDISNGGGTTTERNAPAADPVTGP